MPLRLGQKVDRVIRFLMGVNQPRVAGMLVRHGFSQQELDEGWKLLRDVAGERLNAPEAPTKDPEAIERLDDWENKWFPIIEATLAHRYPKIHDEVFLNLSQTEGPELAIAVGTLLKRVAELEQGDADHKAARELLTRRGLNVATIGEATKHMERLGQVREAPAVDLEAMHATRQKAEEAMWAWYLEWGTIARSAVKDGRLLQQLGFLKVRRGVGVEVVEVEEEVVEGEVEQPQSGQDGGNVG